MTHEISARRVHLACECGPTAASQNRGERAGLRLDGRADRWLEFVHGALELGDEIDCVGVGKDQYRPEAVGEFVAQRLSSTWYFSCAFVRHHQLGEVSDITNEPEHELLVGPRAAALELIQFVVLVLDHQGSTEEAIDVDCGFVVLRRLHRRTIRELHQASGRRITDLEITSS